MSRDLGRDVPDLEKLYARKLWADFSYPRAANKNGVFLRISAPGAWWLRPWGFSIKLSNRIDAKGKGPILMVACMQESTGCCLK